MHFPAAGGFSLIFVPEGVDNLKENPYLYKLFYNFFRNPNGAFFDCQRLIS